MFIVLFVCNVADKVVLLLCVCVVCCLFGFRCWTSAHGTSSFCFVVSVVVAAAAPTVLVAGSASFNVYVCVYLCVVCLFVCCVFVVICVAAACLQ